MYLFFSIMKHGGHAFRGTSSLGKDAEDKLEACYKKWQQVRPEVVSPMPDVKGMGNILRDFGKRFATNILVYSAFDKVESNVRNVVKCLAGGTVDAATVTALLDVEPGDDVPSPLREILGLWRKFSTDVEKYYVEEDGEDEDVAADQHTKRRLKCNRDDRWTADRYILEVMKLRWS